jgi:hypothetical protein
MRTRDGSTSVVIKQTADDARHPDKWFARSEPYPLVACSPVYDAACPLGPQEALTLRYSIAITG